MAKISRLKAGERMGDFACSAGRSLVSRINQSEEQVKNEEDSNALSQPVYDIVKKLPYMLYVKKYVLSWC